MPEEERDARAAIAAFGLGEAVEVLRKALSLVDDYRVATDAEKAIAEEELEVIVDLALRAIPLPEGAPDPLSDLVWRFSAALLAKLRAAEQKYGYANDWRRDGWMDQCRQHLREHLEKGDPRDVAAYCAFLWHHGGSTKGALPEGDGLSREKILGMWAELESGRALPLAEDLREVFNLALRTLPLPEGEVKELLGRLKYSLVVLRGSGRYETSYGIEEAIITIERQAASLATAERWVNDLQSGMFINCVYCGHRYGPDPGTPVAMADVLKAHIELCPSHPLSAMKARAEAAEASLASARRDALEEARVAVQNLMVSSPRDEDAHKRNAILTVALDNIDSLSSPRQEGT